MMGEMMFVIVVSVVIITFIGMIGAITWSIFEETQLGRWIVDGLIGKRDDKDDGQTD